MSPSARRESGLGRVVVATDTAAVADAVRAHGFEAVMTRADHQSGSDRIFEALSALDPDGKVEIVVNVQGDLPTIEPETIRAALAPLDDAGGRYRHARRRDRARGGEDQPERRQDRRLAARRQTGCARSISPAPPRPGARGRSTITSASTPIAAPRWSASSSLPPSPLERRERLEQLRALEAGMRIDVEIVRSVPLGVDTPDDLERARDILAES